MQKKKGVSLIVLVITIIVMIVLAGAIILSLNNSGIIEKSNEAVDLTNIANVREFAQTKWAEAYLETDKTQEALEKYVLEGLDEADINIEDYDIVVTEKGVTVNKKGEVKIITFYINDYLETREFKAEEGMTWIQWVSSSYNTMNITCNSSESTPELYEKDGVFTMIAYYYDSSTDEIMHEEGEKASSNLDWLTGKNKITAGVTYLTEELG